MISPIDFWQDVNDTSSIQKGVDNIPKPDLKNTFKVK